MRLLSVYGFFGPMLWASRPRYDLNDPGALLLMGIDPTALLLLDEDFHVLYGNRSAEQLLGRPLVNLQKEGLLESVVPASQDVFRKAVRNAPTGVTHSSTRLEVRGPDGRAIPVEMLSAAGTGTASPLRAVLLRDLRPPEERPEAKAPAVAGPTGPGPSREASRELLRERMNEVV